MKNKTKKILEKIKTAGSKIKSHTGKYINLSKFRGRSVSDGIAETAPVVFPFLAVDELLKWTEQFTKSTATIYDKAMDAEYLRTHIGGGNHRMFDGGHDIFSALSAAKDASSNDTFMQEILGASSALWKDLTTTNGLPFVTWSKDFYNDTASWFSQHIPGATKDWFYDLCSYDAFEILSGGLGVVALIFNLNDEQTHKLSEVIGTIGIISLISANVLGGIALLVVLAYAIKKGKKIHMKELVKGAGLASISAMIFSYLSLPILIELIIVIIVIRQVKKVNLDPAMLKDYFKRLIPSKSGPKDDIIYL